jgi:hypothetical protein
VWSIIILQETGGILWKQIEVQDDLRGHLGVNAPMAANILGA